MHILALYIKKQRVFGKLGKWETGEFGIAGSFGNGEFGTASDMNEESSRPTLTTGKLAVSSAKHVVFANIAHCASLW